MKINAVLFGATGMIGQGVMIEALEHPEASSAGVPPETYYTITHDYAVAKGQGKN